MTVNFGVLGAGRIGQVHAKAIATVDGAKLVAVADPVEAAAQSVRDAYGCDIRTIDQIADSGDVDAVVICTPTDTHADLIERFCRLGKAVFCEKPIDLSLPRVQACLKVVDDVNGTLMLGFNRRFDPDFRALKAAVDQGRVGRVEQVAITSRDPGLPPADYIKRSGGILRDMTIHDFDIARWLLGEPVDTVQAVGSVLVDPEVGELGDFDTATVLMTTKGGRQCTILNSRRAAYGYDQRIEVFGSKGMVQVDNLHEAKITVAGTDGYRQPPLQDFFMTRYAVAYATEIAEFVEALNAKKEMPATGHDGMMALVLAEAALKSIDEGRQVRVSEILP